MDLFIKGQALVDGGQGSQWIVTTDRVYQRSKETLDGDNCVLLACCLEEAYVGLFERGLYRLGDVGFERCLDAKEGGWCWGRVDSVIVEFVFFLIRERGCK